MINDEKYYALLATGDERTCLDLSEARKLNLSLTRHNGEVIFAGNHCKSEVYTPEVEITCAKHSASYQVLCFDLVGKDQVLLGYCSDVRS